jgi:hypothetical protein
MLDTLGNRTLTRGVHAQRLARWLGEELAEGIARQSAGFPAPIPIANVPGPVWAYNGDIIGRIAGGGFASLSDLISERTTGGKGRVYRYQKVGIAAPAAGASQSLWAVGNLPSAGANAGAAGAGTVFTNASAGALPITNPGGGDTLHFVTWQSAVSSVAAMALMLYDYLWGVNINHATTSNPITGVPTRYQTAGTAPGNFLTARVTTVLAATAHNITCTYVDQDGNAPQAAAAQAVRVSSAVNTLPFTQPKWFYDLAAGDTGLRNLTNIALSAASTGAVDWKIAHAIAIIGMPLANIPFVLDGINSAFNLEEIQANAALAFLEYFKAATTATTYNGEILLVSG